MSGSGSRHCAGKCAVANSVSPGALVSGSGSRRCAGKCAVANRVFPGALFVGIHEVLADMLAVDRYLAKKWAPDGK